MQALQVQFLNLQNVPKKEAIAAHKEPSNLNSFKSMLDEVSKKSEPIDKMRNSRPKDKAPESSQNKNTKDIKDTIEDRVNGSLKEEAEEEPCSFTQDEPMIVFGKVVQDFAESDDCSLQPALSSDETDESLSLDRDINGRADIPINAFPVQQTAFLPDAYIPVVEEFPAIEAVPESFVQNSEENGAAEFDSEFLGALADDFVQDNAEGALAADETEEFATVLAKDDAAKESSKKIERREENSPRSKENSASAPVFSVIDERGKLAKREALSEDREARGLVAESVHKQGNTLEVAINLANTAAQDILSTNGQSAGADGSTFQQMLASQIQNNAPDFVKAGNIILKDADTGVINMNLKPESLGNVKISLQISDKGIEGQITVASKEAFEAFKQNMDTLKHAFQENGFENASLNLSLGSDSDAGQFGHGQQQSSEQFFANKTFATYAEGRDVPASTANAAGAYKNDGYHVDVVA